MEQGSLSFNVESIRGIKGLNNWEDAVLVKFDAFNNFKQYFPKNNLSYILERLNQHYLIMFSKRLPKVRKSTRKGTFFKKDHLTS